MYDHKKCSAYDSYIYYGSFHDEGYYEDISEEWKVLCGAAEESRNREWLYRGNDFRTEGYQGVQP